MMVSQVKSGLGFVAVIGLFLLPVNARASDGAEAWQDLQGATRTTPLRASGERWLQLDEGKLRDELAMLDAAASTTLSLPMADGSMRRFEVKHSLVMAPELAAKFPQIQTFQGQALDGEPMSVRLELTERGFGAMFFGTEGVQLIEHDLPSGHYLSFARERSVTGSRLVCGADDVTVHLASAFSKAVEMPSPRAAQPLATGTSLRTYRTAIAATGEYSTAVSAPNPVSVSLSMAAIATAINRVNQIYETELALRLVLVANSNLLVYTNGSTDPYTNQDGVTMLTQNQTNLDAIIGNSNYDFGHVFSTGGGGVASQGICQAGGKARGVTGLSNPVGDPFYVDYVAHEMGHQLSGSHTFNGTTNSCGGGNRSSGSAYEPGSGSSIMAYAGICGSENLQPNSDPYFHIRSMEQIHAYTQTGSGSSCGALTSTTNGTPVVGVVAGATIPARTPFALTATATDPNGDALTYDWQEYDLGTAAPPNDDVSAARPVFRAFAPTTSPTRVFPKLSDILGNVQTIGESLPTRNRTMNFRVAVRDNRSGGGGVQWSGTTSPAVASTAVTIFSTGTAFAINSLNSAASLSPGSTQTLTWEVAGTTAAPISCPNVEIAWSTNGGSSFSVLTPTTANDGSENFTVPSTATTQARIRVRCANNIFFDINNANLVVPSIVFANGFE